MIGEELELPPRSQRPRRRVQPGEIDFTPYQPKQVQEQQRSDPEPAREAEPTSQTQRATPAEPSPRPAAELANQPAQRVKRNRNVNLSMPIDVMDRAKATWAHTARAEDQPRFAHFVTAALLEYIKQMEEKHNSGRPFPNPGTIILPTGAPPKDNQS